MTLLIHVGNFCCSEKKPFYMSVIFKLYPLSHLSVWPELYIRPDDALEEWLSSWQNFSNVSGIDLYKYQHLIIKMINANACHRTDKLMNFIYFWLWSNETLVSRFRCYGQRVGKFEHLLRLLTISVYYSPFNLAIFMFLHNSFGLEPRILGEK